MKQVESVGNDGRRISSQKYWRLM